MTGAVRIGGIGVGVNVCSGGSVLELVECVEWDGAAGHGSSVGEGECVGDTRAAIGRSGCVCVHNGMPMVGVSERTAEFETIDI